MNDENILISVIIPTYNRGNVIHKALDSVLKQTYKRWELIIVDDGSTDDTRIRLEPYLKNENIKYHYKNNEGVSSARNLGMMNSKGEYISFLDSDDEFEKNKLEVQLSEMLQFNSSFSICNGIEIIGMKSNVSSKYSQSFVFGQSFLLSNRVPICASFFMIRNNLQLIFNEELKSGEDSDFVMRFLISGEILFVKEPLVRRNKSLDGIRLSVNPKSRIEGMMERINLYQRNEYRLPEEINLMRLSKHYIHLGFWYFYDNQLARGRSALNSGLMLSKSKMNVFKFRTLYYVSFIPGIIRLMKKVVLFLWKRNLFKV